MTGDLGSAAADQDVYARLIAELDASGCRYRLIEHALEGRPEACHIGRDLVVGRVREDDERDLRRDLR